MRKIEDEYRHPLPPEVGDVCFDCCMGPAVFVMATFFILSGFSKANAVDVYQQRYAQHYSCLYNRSGSCSETFKKDGLVALVQKCRLERVK